MQTKHDLYSVLMSYYFFFSVVEYSQFIAFGNGKMMVGGKRKKIHILYLVQRFAYSRDKNEWNTLSIYTQMSVQ